MNDEPIAESRPKRLRAQRKLGLLAAALLGTGTAVTMVLVVLAFARRDGSPDVSSESLDEAVQRWRQNGPSSYNVETVVEGRQKDVYQVSVRNGEAVSLVHNGTAIHRPHGWDTWSVSGMFDTIRRDLDTVKRVESGRGDKYTPSLRLKADFDPKFGYPQRYRRTPKSGGGQIIWNVTRFEVVQEQ